MTADSRRGLLSASAQLAAAMLVAGGGNYILNLALARMLDRAAFGDASLMVTWMLALTSVAVGFQLVAVRMTAGVSSPMVIDQVRSRLLRRALQLGVILGIAMVAGSPTLKVWFQTESATPFVILALGIPAYLGLAVDRGLRQGASDFKRLAASYIVEGAVRLSTALSFVALGYGVNGATWGLTISFVASWAVVGRRSTGNRRSRTQIDVSFGKTVGPVGLLLLGQVVINNGDVLLAKSVLSPDEAGAYIAVALAGRAVFFGSWAIVQALLPAAIREPDARDSSVLRLGIVMVALFSLFAAGVLFAAGPFISSVLFGSGFPDAAPLLGPYALAAGCFAVMNLIATIDVARQRPSSAVIVLGAGLVQLAALGLFASSPTAMVWLQVLVMFGALFTLCVVRLPARTSASVRLHGRDRHDVTR